MQLEKSIRKQLILPKVEGCIKLEIDTQLDSPKQREWAYTARSGGSKEIGSSNAITTITISSGRRIQLYTPMQESKRAQRLKNIPYELQYFQTSLPTKSFKSSHLMNEELLKKPKEQIENKQRWQLHSHFNKMNLALTQYQIKRFERCLKKTESTDDVNTIKKLNEENIEKEKQKRNTQYKQATQDLINSFTKKFNIKALYNDLQTNQQQ
ncbi:unnamed protein product [Paramecium octaurelia]|uniref:Uncharacterized protein n=1 Tax=Paramecium octaurelia TaxID=43137 RepID=A0A8S1X7S2_PAROT|nr:unnamed protein product [Paramecium octaurelia]